MQVVVDGLLTTYQKVGKADRTAHTIVIVHGWGDKAANWQSFANALSGNYSIIIPDLPGFGQTEAPPRAWDLNNYADFIAQFLDKIGIHTVDCFIAHSNGGAIVMRGLGGSTLATERLVLLASAGIRGEYKGRMKAIRYLAKTGKALTTLLPASVKKKLRRTLYSSVGSDMLVAEHLQETFKKIVSDDVQADAARINIPTLLIYGEQDVSAPVRYGRMFHEVMSNSTLEIIPAAEHFVQLDQPQRVLELIKEFLQ